MESRICSAEEDVPKVVMTTKYPWKWSNFNLKWILKRDLSHSIIYKLITVKRETYGDLEKKAEISLVSYIVIFWRIITSLIAHILRVKSCWDWFVENWYWSVVRMSSAWQPIRNGKRAESGLESYFPPSKGPSTKTPSDTRFYAYVGKE